jgi:hypothetical protein
MPCLSRDAGNDPTTFAAASSYVTIEGENRGD